MRILVTGGAGYIGSHCIRLLHAHGIKTVAFDNLEHGHRDAVQGALHVGDLRQRTDLDAVFQTGPFDAVFHFAALAAVEESVEKPGLYAEVNTGGTLNLLEAMRKHGVGSLVLSSTAAVYGEPASTPILEDFPRSPVNPYGLSKVWAEDLAEYYGRLHGLRWVAFRYFNVAGREFPYPSRELRDHDTHLLTRILNVAQGVMKEFHVYGTDYPTPDGTCVRDYVHVSDICSAHLAGLRYLEKGGSNTRFNIGTGRGFSVKEVLEACRKATGHAIPAQLKPRRAGDPATLVASSAKLSAATDWRCQHDLASIVASAWKWNRLMGEEGR